MAEIVDSVPTSPFRNAIPNPKRYMKHNLKTIEDVAKAAYEGDLGMLETLLSTGDELNLFNGDLNAFATSLTALHMAAKAGQTECVELLLRAKADPHMKENVAFGEDPEEGKTALELAKEYGFDDATAELLEQAEKVYPYGWYVPVGPLNNSKGYNCWEWGKKPEKHWYLGRPGAAKKQGLDPKKYGYPEEPEVKIDLDEIAMPALIAPPAVKLLPVGLLFPGSESAYKKMMSGVQDLPGVKALIQEANGILGWDVKEWCLEGPESAMEDTAKAQPATFVASLAGIEKMKGDKAEIVERCQAVAGLNLGEYTALVVAGVLDFKDALKIVKIRAEAMASAASKSPQASLSVAGLDKGVVSDICQKAQAQEGGSAVCVIANELFPNGFAVSGTSKAVNTAKEMVDKAGALQARLMANAGGFNTPLMEPAQALLGEALDAALPNMRPPKKTIYMNCNATAVKPGTNPKEIVALLKQQVTSPVLWQKCVQAMIKDGISELHEVGPMKQLRAMMKRIDAKVWGSTYNVEV